MSTFLSLISELWRTADEPERGARAFRCSLRAMCWELLETRYLASFATLCVLYFCQSIKQFKDDRERANRRCCELDTHGHHKPRGKSDETTE